MFPDDEKEGDHTLTATGIAEYIRFNCCPRFFKLKIDRAKEKSRRWHEAFKPISPLLYSVGKKLEEKKVADLKEKAADYHDFSKYDPNQHGWAKAQDSLKELCEVIESQISAGERADCRPVLLYQVPMKGHIGVWNVKGIADLIAIWPLKDGKVKIRIFELKSSWKEQTAHRIQVAIYVFCSHKNYAAYLQKLNLKAESSIRETSLENLSARKPAQVQA